MKRRTRITLAAAALTVAALGGTYGLVAEQGLHPPAPPRRPRRRRARCCPGTAASNARRRTRDAHSYASLVRTTTDASL